MWLAVKKKEFFNYIFLHLDNFSINQIQSHGLEDLSMIFRMALARSLRIKGLVTKSSMPYALIFSCVAMVLKPEHRIIGIEGTMFLMALDSCRPVI